MALDLVAIQAIQDEKTTSLDAIENKKDAVINEMSSAREVGKVELENKVDELLVSANQTIAQGNTQVTRVTGQGDTEVARVTAQGDTEVGEVTTAKTNAVNAVNAIKAEIETIVAGDPTGGSALSVGDTTEADLNDRELKSHAMTKAEFLALQEKRKRDYAGSGFLEWGKNNTDSAIMVNEGITVPAKLMP